MEQRNPKFRLRLNLFDTIVILVALAAAAFLLWNRLKPSGTPIGSSPAVPVQYTIRLQQVQTGLPERIHAGDKLEDTVKNYELGQVVSYTYKPATQSVLNQEEKRYVLAEVPGYYDVDIVVESTADTSQEDKILVGSGYELRVGERIYVRGPGYMGSGDVYAIERVD